MDEKEDEFLPELRVDLEILGLMVESKNNFEKEYLKIYEQNLIDRKKRECAKEEIVSKLTEKEKVFEGFKIKFTNNF